MAELDSSTMRQRPAAKEAAPHPLEHLLRQHYQIALASILTLFTLLASFYVVHIPFGEGPDEAGHALYIHHILETGDLPPLLTRADVEALEDPVQIWNTHTHHPPLYYLLGALLTSWTAREDIEAYYVPNVALFERTQTPGGINLWLQPLQTSGDTHHFYYALRLLSVALGAATLWIMARAVRRFTENPALSLAAVALPLALPSFLMSSAAVGNDMLIICISALGVAWGLDYLKRQTLTAADYLLVTAICVSAIYTKLTGVTLLVISYGCVFAVLLMRGRGWFAGLRFLLITTTLTTLLTAPWFYRLWTLTGSPFATGTVQDLWGRPAPLDWAQFSAELTRIWQSLWVSVGYSDFPFVLPAPYYVYALLYVLGGFSLALFYPHAKKLSLLWLYGVMGVVLAFLLYVNLNLDVSYGRLLLPALLPAALLVTLGWWTLAKPLAILLLLPLLAISAFVTIIEVPRLYHDVIPLDALPADAFAVTTQTDRFSDLVYFRSAAPPRSIDAYTSLDLFVRGEFPADVLTAFAVIERDTNERLGYSELFIGMADWESAAAETFYQARVHIPSTIDSAYADYVFFIEFIDMETGAVLDAVYIWP